MKNEALYLLYRKIKGFFVSCAYIICRIFPINDKKITVCSIEGQSGYSCNPKYIVDELLRENADVEIYWIVNDVSKHFPKKVIKVQNRFWNRIYHLATAKVWIDNSRKELGTIKRKKQLYIQTWHATLAFKPAGNMRKDFPKIAYWISRNDSKMADYVLTNSEWCDKLYPDLLFTVGNTLRIGSPRCDALINNAKRIEGYESIRKRLGISQQTRLVLYAPTFRGGSQKSVRKVYFQESDLNYRKLRESLQKRFGGEWLVLLRLHPQLASQMRSDDLKIEEGLIDVTQYDDMNQILIGVDAIISDYSSVVFDASYAYIPAFLYAEDIEKFTNDRGTLLWNSEELPFPVARNSIELLENIQKFDAEKYTEELNKLFQKVALFEPGDASIQVVKIIDKFMNQRER